MDKILHFRTYTLLAACLFMVLSHHSSAQPFPMVFWSDSFDLPATGTNNAGMNWSGSLPTPGGGTNTGGAQANLWVMGTSTKPPVMCTGTGKKLFINSTFFGSDNIYWSNQFSDIMDATPPIATWGKTNMIMHFDWRCDGVVDKDYGQIGLSADSGATWNWLPRHYNGVDTCKHDSITIGTQYQDVPYFRIAFRFVSGQTACGTCDPPFNIDNIALTTYCPVILDSLIAEGPCRGKKNGMIGFIATGAPSILFELDSNLVFIDSNRTGVFTNLHAGSFHVAMTGGGCTAQSSADLFEKPAVPPPNATYNNPVCLNDTLIVSADSVAGATYSWNGPHRFSGLKFTQPVATFADSGLYTVMATINSCSSLPVPVNVKVHPLPTPGKLSVQDTLICSGDSAPVCESAGFACYHWNTGASTACISAMHEGEYYVTVCDNNGCKAESEHRSIHTYPVSSVPITLQGDTLSSSGANSYQWFLGGSAIKGATHALYIAVENGLYSVEITDLNGCKVKSKPVEITNVGISEIGSNLNFSIQPNPASDVVELEVGKYIAEATMRIIDITGREVIEQTFSGTKMKVSTGALTSGVYFVQLVGPHQNIGTRKLVIR